MTLDSNRPMFYRVTIDGTGFVGAAPADGFIDNTIVEKYMAVYILTGSTPIVTMTDGDTIHINGIAITFVTGALDVAGVIAAINAFTELHHSVASNDGSDDLVLTNEDGFEGNPITVDGSVAVLTALGYVTPVLSAIPGTPPTNLALSEAKSRGNCRWKFVIEQIERDSTPMAIGTVVKTGYDVNTAPAEIDFTIGYANGDPVYTYDETNSNAVIEGLSAIKRMVARALVEDKTQLFQVYDPTSATPGFIIGGTIESLHVGQLTSSLSTAEAAITITPIASIR